MELTSSNSDKKQQVVIELTSQDQDTVLLLVGKETDARGKSRRDIQMIQIVVSM